MRSTGTNLLLAAFLLPLAALGCSHDPTRVGPEPALRGQPAAAADPDDLVVHEWGTFTSLAGSAGVSLDGMHHASDSLPGFVHAAGPAAVKSPFHVYGDTSSYIPARHVNGKMETPVLYFYSGTAQRVRVHVDFENGLLSEWYPDAASLSPSREALAGSASRGGAEAVSGAVDVAKIERSSLEWDLTLTPFEEGAPAGVPSVEHDDPWQFAREVRASFVQPVLPSGAAPTEAEHYVFYRGLGRLSLPIELRYCLGQLKARNSTDTPIAAAFALQMSETGGRFVSLGRFDAGEQKVVTFEGKALQKDDVVDSIGREVMRVLIGEGLYEDEARAMVRTWSPTWFASEGTRVLYVLPRSTTDAMLPLKITPQPKELVRVLVGRQDILPPEVEDDVEKALEDRISPNAARREAAMQRLGRLGRFLEPAVRRAVGYTASDAVRRSGNEVLAQFQ
jgi:hypothetical protein